MRFIVVVILLAVAGCNSHYHELAQTKKTDPVWQLNEGKWSFSDNALTTGPVMP